MARGLTLKQKEFCKLYPILKNGTEAVKKSYDVKNDNTAGVMANELLKIPKVEMEIKQIDEYVKKKIIEGSKRAINRVNDLIDNAKDDNIKLSASRDILDRAGYKPEEKEQQPTIINIVGNIPRPIEAKTIDN